MGEVLYFANGTKLFAAGYPSGVVQVFDPATGKELRRIETPPEGRGTHEYALPTPDLRNLYVPVNRRRVVSFEKDGKKQRRIEFNGEVLAWDLTSGKGLMPFKPSVSGRGVLAAYLSPAGDKLVTVEQAPYNLNEAANMVVETVLWDLKTRNWKSLGNGIGIAAFSRDGRRLAVALSSAREEPLSLIVMDFQTGHKMFADMKPAKGNYFWWPAFSPDGKTLAIHDSAGTINQPGTIRLLDIETGKELVAFESAGKYPFKGATFSPDGRRLAATDYNESLTIWDVTLKKVERIKPLNGLRSGREIVFSPDGKMLAVLAQAEMSRADLDEVPDPADLPQPRLFLFDLAGGGEPEVVICPHGYCGGLAFSPDGQTIAVGGSGGVHLFNVSKR